MLSDRPRNYPDKLPVHPIPAKRSSKPIGSTSPNSTKMPSRKEVGSCTLNRIFSESPATDASLWLRDRESSNQNSSV